MSAIRHAIDWPLPPRPKEQLAIWTAPAKGRCGQMCALYEAKRQDGRGAWVAFGRMCSDAVWAYEGDEGTWAWVQWRQARSPIDYATAKERFGIGHVQGSYGSLDEDLFRRLALAMVRGDSTGRRVLERWRDGRAFPSPTQLDVHQLVAARAEADPHERDLYPPIAHLLKEEGWRELPTDLADVVKTLRGATPIDAKAEARRLPDIALCRPRSRRLLLVEVKRHALPRIDNFHPIGQVLSYAQATRKALRRNKLAGWTVEPLIVAESFSEALLEQASRSPIPGGARGIPCRRFEAGALIDA